MSSVGRKYESGASKRRKQKKEEKKMKETLKKTRKLDNFFKKLSNDDEIASSSTASSICMDLDENVDTSESNRILKSKSFDDNYTEQENKDAISVDSNMDEANNENIFAEVRMEYKGNSNINPSTPLMQAKEILIEEIQPQISEKIVGENKNFQMETQDESNKSSPITTEDNSSTSPLEDNDPGRLKNIKNLTPELVDHILKVGPCQPLEHELMQRAFPKDKNGRSFHPGWYHRKLNDNTFGCRTWLSYSKSEDRIYCLDCILFGKNRNSAWISPGFNNWNNGSLRILAHETSETHIEAVLANRVRANSLPLLPSITTERKMQILFKREIMKHLIDVTLYLARHCLAFRGHREGKLESIKGNFKDLVILLAKYSPNLAAYIQPLFASNKKAGHSLISWRRQNALIDAISSYTRNKICEDVRKNKFFSISVDSSFDKSKKEQVSFIIRYACEESGNIYERLLAVKESPSTTGKDLFDLFNSICDDCNLNWKSDLVGQSHDGASNMRSQYKSLKALIQQSNPQATYIWCWAHKLNLVIVSAVGSSSNAVDLFGNLEKLCSFIGRSKKRSHLYETKQKARYPKNRIKRLKRVQTTRWMSHSYALLTVLDTFEAVLETLEDIRQNEGPSDKEAGAQAGGLLSYFMSENFLLTAHVFMEIFKTLDPLTKLLQSADLDLLSAMTSLQSKLDVIKKLRGRFDEISLATTEFIDKVDVEISPLTEIRCRKRKKMPGEFASDEVIVNPREAFKIKTFYTTVDTVDVQLRERFLGDNDDSNSTLGIIKDLSLLSRKRMEEVSCDHSKLPVDAFSTFCSVYRKYLNVEEVRKEYCQFASCFKHLDRSQFLPEYLHEDEPKDKDESNLEDSDDSDLSNFSTDDNENKVGKEQPLTALNAGSLPEIFKVFCQSRLQVVFPNLHILLKISVTIPVTSSSTERSFSKLKRIKTDLRSTMAGDRLEGLLTIASEKDIVLDYDKIIDMFSRSSPLLEKDLLY